MNFYSLRIGDEKINLSDLGSKDEIKNGSYVPPFSSRDFIIPVKNKGKATEVFWQVINDNGGVSREFKSTVQ
ncbi:gram-negative pili assembly chaperone, C-terminal domain protein [Yersinia pestis PY-66]|nr:gram-negative pili assembly chaperone, C-terminal domain protein [Yersinia pestis PY-66]